LRCRTGIEGLDKMLNGGIPKGNSVLLYGGPGSGKTICSVQFILEGAQKYDETGILILLEESAKRVTEYMVSVGLDLESAIMTEKVKVFSIERFRTKNISFAYSDLDTMKHKGVGDSLLKDYIPPAQRLQMIMAEIDKYIENVDRIALDSVTSLRLQHSEPEFRQTLHGFFEYLAEHNVTSLIAAEALGHKAETVAIEQYVADGVIVLHNIMSKTERIRAAEILKMRGTNHDKKLRPLEIGPDGITVEPEEQVFMLT